MSRSSKSRKCRETMLMQQMQSDNLVDNFEGKQWPIERKWWQTVRVASWWRTFSTKVRPSRCPTQLASSTRTWRCEPSSWDRAVGTMGRRAILSRIPTQPMASLNGARRAKLSLDVGFCAGRRIRCPKDQKPIFKKRKMLILRHGSHFDNVRTLSPR